MAIHARTGARRHARGVHPHAPFRIFAVIEWRKEGSMSRSRREFLVAGLGAAVALRTGAQTPAKRSATDWVTLGKSGVKVTRLAFGTGTHGGRVQRDLGQDGFTRLVRHAYDRGIRFFETADSYGEMHKMLGIALKGIPRDSYQLM